MALLPKACPGDDYRFTPTPGIQECTHAVVLGRPGGRSDTAEALRFPSCKRGEHPWTVVMEFDGEKIVVVRCPVCKSERWASGRPVLVREVSL